MLFLYISLVTTVCVRNSINPSALWNPEQRQPSEVFFIPTCTIMKNLLSHFIYYYGEMQIRVGRSRKMRVCCIAGRKKRQPRQLPVTPAERDAAASIQKKFSPIIISSDFATLYSHK